MQRISSPTAVSTLPAVITGGDPGFFAQVTPGVGVPTIMTPDWANGVQEELFAFVLSTGLTPSLSVLTQVRDSVMAIGYFADSGAANNYAVSTVVSGVVDGEAFTLPAVVLLAGTQFLIKAKTSNTGASIVTVDGVELSWTNNAGGALVSGDIVANSVYSVAFDGTGIRMQAVTNGQIAAMIAAAISATLFPPVGINGATHTFVAGDGNKTIRRNNSGAAMVDTLPGATAGALPAGWSVIIANYDPTGLYALTAGPGSGLASQTNFSNNTAYIGPGQTMQVTSDGTNYVVTNAPARAKVTANPTLFVSTAGSNSANAGITSGTSFRDPTHAYQWAQNVLDLASFTLTISVGAGSFAAASFNGPLIGQASPVIIQGAGSANTTFPNGISCSGGANVQPAAMTLATPSSGSAALVANDTGTKITLGAGVVFAASTGTQVQCNTGALIYLANSYTISGGAAAHILQLAGGVVDVNAIITITLTGTPVWSVAGIISQAGGVINFGSNATITGAATGVRFQTLAGGIINTNGAGVSWWPGSTAGTGTGYF